MMSNGLRDKVDIFVLVYMDDKLDIQNDVEELNERIREELSLLRSQFFFTVLTWCNFFEQ